MNILIILLIYLYKFKWKYPSNSCKHIPTERNFFTKIIQLSES